MVKGRQDPRVSRDWKRVRIAVLARDGHVCAYCGQDATTVDHVISIKAGGNPLDMDNCVAACRRCNSSKGSRSQAVFLAANSTPPASRQALEQIPPLEWDLLLHCVCWCMHNNMLKYPCCI